MEYGKSNDLIQGTCGWGAENAYFDKTGYKWEEYRRCNSITGGCNWTDDCANAPIADQCTSDADCQA